MLRFFVLAAIVALATAQEHGRQLHQRVPVRVVRIQRPLVHQDRFVNDYAEPTPYNFQYNIKDDYNAEINRQESGDGHGNVQGSYGYTDGYGIYRQVQYVADGHGFRAKINTNEPGTDNQNPADVHIEADPIQVGHAPHRNQEHRQVAHAPAHRQIVRVPVHRQAVHAPVHRQVAQAPVHRQVVRAPVHRQVVRAPVHRQVVRAPVHRQVVHAPVHRQVVHAPVHRQINHAPIRQHVVERPSHESISYAPAVNNGYGNLRQY